MGLMHMLLLPEAVGYELNDKRRGNAVRLGLDARDPKDSTKADTIFVCPGSKAALDFAIALADPGATIVLFAPMPPGGETAVDLHRLYFQDIKIATAYSCGPSDTLKAVTALRDGKLKAEQVVSDFIGIDELPDAYQKMKRGEILKPMVLF
jgi:L-iditol 2-dehydrogenase